MARRPWIERLYRTILSESRALDLAVHLLMSSDDAYAAAYLWREGEDSYLRGPLPANWTAKLADGRTPPARDGRGRARRRCEAGRDRHPAAHPGAPALARRALPRARRARSVRRAPPDLPLARHHLHRRLRAAGRGRAPDVALLPRGRPPDLGRAGAARALRGGGAAAERRRVAPPAACSAAPPARRSATRRGKRASRAASTRPTSGASVGCSRPSGPTAGRNNPE